MDPAPVTPLGEFNVKFTEGLVAVTVNCDAPQQQYRAVVSITETTVDIVIEELVPNPAFGRWVWEHLRSFWVDLRTMRETDGGEAFHYTERQENE
jgi:hypothetical protein